MSRLAQIKARADAATEGPWVRGMHSPDMSGRSGWYIRGPRKLGLRSMVLNSRMLPGDAEFIEHAREDVPWLIERIGELNGAICWDTTCLNCSSLLDSNYDQYVRAEIAEAEVERLTDLCDEFRKREESQDCIRERLTAEVERLERWKFEATEVMSGLRELGKALGLGLGVQITGPAALAEVTRLTAEREWFKDRFPCDGACVDAPEEACSRHGRNPADLWRIIREVAAERNALAAQVDRVEKLAEWFDSVQAEHLSQDDCQCEMKDCYECGPWHACTHNGPPGRARQIRDALAGSEADTGAEEAGHRCEPYYSRAECGQCGWQEQWCATCSRQMCGCATGATDQDAMGADQ